MHYRPKCKNGCYKTPEGNIGQNILFDIKCSNIFLDPYPKGNKMKNKQTGPN